MKSILVTGGTGSFGRAFATHLLATEDYGRIVIFSRGEHAQETMERELNDPRLRFFIGDVRDRDRLEMAMRNVDVVVHAAALKIVPTAEYNPTECIATNVGGAENVIKAALSTGVKRVVALSTDKAVNPINLYGASKLCAEKIFIAANGLAAGACEFIAVRYGNVAGSNGSVIPLFKKMHADGKRLTVTNPDMTRFHITMDQAISLVEYAISKGKPREIIVPKIPSLRVVDLVKAINGTGEYDTVGVRPGEKIHETLLSEDESQFTIAVKDYYIINGMGCLVHEGFRYSSNTNHDWLDIDDLRELCAS